MSNLKFEYIQIIQQLKNSSMESYESFVDKVIDEQKNIKEISEILTRTDSKHLIDMIKSQTIFASFYINSWCDFINKVKLNKMVRQSINSSLIPSNRKLHLLIETFHYCFKIQLTSSVLHFFTVVSDQYIMFLISQLIKQSNKSVYTISRKINFNENETKLINILNKKPKTIKETETFDLEFEKIDFPSFKNAKGWKVTVNPYYYKDSKLFSIVEIYDGMGYYIILSASLSIENKYKPYFFRLEGGSDYTEVERNKKFYQTHKPPHHKMYNLNQVIDFIENNTYHNKIFTYSD